MNVLESYRKYVLLPIENNLKELYIKYYSKNIFIRKKVYKKLIEEYEKIYLEKLNEFDKMIKEYYDIK